MNRLLRYALPAGVCAVAMTGWLLAEAAPVAAEGTGNTTAADCNASVVSAKVAVDPGGARVGEPVTLTWSVGGPRRTPGHRAYFILSVPSTVRFDGNGFFALAAGAPNPDGTTFGAGSTRAIAPLHTAFAATSGAIQILPYVADLLPLRWAVVNTGPCGEQIAAQGTVEPIAIRPGAPQIIVHDEFADSQPRKVTRALEGPFEVHEFDGRFEVFEAETGALILKRQGYEPTFSPTGRFLIVRTVIAETYEVIDLAADRIIGRYEAWELSWSHADSFLYSKDARAGKLEIVRSLQGRRHALRAIVPTRGQLARAKLGVIGAEEGSPRARPAALDIEPYGTGGAFSDAAEMWSFDLSVEQGIVTFLNRFGEDLDQNKTAAKQVMVYDLGAKADSIVYSADAAGWTRFKSAFGDPQPKLDDWNTGQTRLTTSVYPVPGTNQADRHEVFQTGKVVEGGQAVLARAEPVSPNAASSRALQSPFAAGATDSSYMSVLGGNLPHLPHTTVAELRAGRDNAALKKIEAEIKLLYPAKAVRFGGPTSTNYSVSGFPDPVVVPRRREEVVELDLAQEGRDLWRWEIGNKRYWLTQTVSSDRSQHTFEFTMLSVQPRGKPRHADLVKAANVFDAGKRPVEKGLERYRQHRLGDHRAQLEQAFGDPSIVGISGERFLILVTRPIVRIIVFDLGAWQVACGIPDPVDGSAIKSVVMHGDGQHITQTNRDGSVYVYACTGGDVVLSGAYVDDEFVAMDRSGYFDGTDDAAGYVEILIPGLPGRHVLSQFERKLKRPGVAREALHGARPAAAPVINAPPLLRLASAATAGSVARIRAFSPVGLDYVQIYQDGRPFRRVAVKGNTAEIEVPEAALPDIGGLNAFAVDQTGIVSAPLRLSTGTARQKNKGRIHALGVGVDRYPLVPPLCGPDGTRSCDLAFAAADARRVIQAVARSPLHKERNLTVLTNEDASQSAILDALDRIIAQAEANDTIVVFFAAHGLVGANNQLLLALSATVLGLAENTSLSFEQVSTRLRSSKAKVVVLLDVCHAGLADRTAIATNDAAVDRLVTNSGASMVVFSASKGRQFSKETAQGGGGRFSVAFDGILTKERERHDADANGAISIDELYRALKVKVVRESDGTQTPWLSRNLVVGDFDLF